MSEKSGAQPSVRKGLLKPWKVRSVLTKARRVVFLNFAVLVVICVAAIGSWRIQLAQIDYLFLTINPVTDANIEIFRDMTQVQSLLLHYQLSARTSDLTKYREARIHILAEIAIINERLAKLVGHKKYSSDESILELEKLQEEAIGLWLANASKSERAVRNSESPNFTQSANLFDDFLNTNNQLDARLQLERTSARENVRSVGATGALIVTTGVVVAAIIGLLFGLRLARKLTKPVIDLTDTMRRHREGDLNARAIENQDSLETRDLTRDFNLLAEHGSQLEQIRSQALEMHHLTVKIEHEIRGATDTQQALQILCVGLGEGIGVDRVMANTIGIDLRMDKNAQWYRPDLPPLADIPVELIPHMTKLVQTLWASSRHSVTADRPLESDRSEHDKIFYRSTDFRASIMVPVGLGDQAVGMIYVVTVDSARQWSDSEVQAVERVAAFLAQFIVEQTHRDQLNDHVARLEQLNLQKDTFVSTVSHELRTPLTSIIGYLEVLKDGYAGDLTEEQSRMVEVMDRNADRLLKLIEDLLALNKRESQAGIIQMDNVSMSEIVTAVCYELSPLAESGAIKIECDVGPPSAVVQGDKGKLQSVVVNIVSNAVKFSPRGSVVTIDSKVDESSHRVLFTCQDHGIGIPAVDQGNLFKRFYRASNAMTKFIPGTGLGLTIVKQIVDAHGGEIHLTSVEGVGTTVVIELPLSPQGLL